MMGAPVSAGGRPYWFVEQLDARRCPSLGTDLQAGEGPVPNQGGDPVSNGEVVRVEHKGSKDREVMGSGRRRDSGHPEVNRGEPRAGNDGAYPASEESQTEGKRNLDSKQGLAYWITWQTTLYAFVLGMLCVFLVPLTNFWWIVPVLGATVPLVLAMLLDKSGSVPNKLDAKNKEQELLEALAERGELTPTTAAMRTSLTVDEASKMLDELAGKGHLKLQTQDGIMAYSLPEHDRLPAKDAALETSLARSEADAASARQLDDPLSERELEVLTLLASGRTNAEISRDLFVAVGTVKSHVNNIYRKLEAANRAEAVARARDLNLLR
jgi:DNA-binding CsgD family transcriptional regulator